MPIVHISQLVICCLEPDTLYQVTIFGQEETLDNFVTSTPLHLIDQAKRGRLKASYDPTILYHLKPLEKPNVDPSL